METPEKTYDIDKERLAIANEVFKIHNLGMIQMLKNSIQFAKSKHEKKAYQNVITYIKKQEKERIDTIEKSLKEFAKTEIVTPELVIVNK